MSRRRACLTLAGILLVLWAAPVSVSAHARADDADAQRQTAADAAAEFVASMNAARAAEGLDPLTVDPDLTRAAAGWAAWMARNDTLQHSDDIVSGAPPDWTKVGENVGRGGSVPSIWQAFMDSPTHAANVLDPAYTRIGIAVVWGDDDILYTAHRFAGAVSDRAQPEPTRRPAPTPTPAPPPPLSIPFADGDNVGADGDDVGADPEGGGRTGSSTPVPLDPERLRATLQLLVDAAA